jgi:hypothetical protein
MRRALGMVASALVLAGCEPSDPVAAAAKVPEATPGWSKPAGMDGPFYDLLVASYIAEASAEYCPGLLYSRVKQRALVTEAKDQLFDRGGRVNEVLAYEDLARDMGSNADVQAYFAGLGITQEIYKSVLITSRDRVCPAARQEVAQQSLIGQFLTVTG